MNKLSLCLLLSLLTNFLASEGYAQDSLALKLINHVTDSVNRLTKLKQQKLDSLNERARLQQQRLDSVRVATNNKLDELNQRLSGRKYIQSSDSVLRSFQKELSVTYLHDSIDSRVRKRANTLDSLIAAKRQKLDSLGGLFGVDLDAKIKELDVSVPGLPGVGNKLNFSSDLGGVDKLNLKSPLNNIGSISTPNFPDVKLPNANREISLPEGANDLQKLNQKFNQLSILQDSTISADTLAHMAEQYAQQKLKNNKAIGSLTQDQQKMLAEQQKLEELAQSLQPSEAEQKAREQMDELVQTHTEKLKNDLEDVGKLQMKYRNVADMRQLPKRPPNEMKGKPLIERLIPALTFQAFIKDGKALDVAPSLGYRFSGHIRGGVGVYQRFYVAPDFSKTSIKGVRVYSQLRFWGTKYVHLEAEHSTVPPINPAAREGSTGFVNRLNFGLYHTYRISKYINGHSLLLYDLKQLKHFPNTSNSSIRFGIDIQLYKRRKSP
ncbi:MAG: hypothetical protein KF775_18450 [Cyclobacteriaceae bacterium]|nr:hypothetical protein [Cyclobacteriaceae bacterium]